MKNKIEYTASRFYFYYDDTQYEVVFNDETDTHTTIINESTGAFVFRERNQKHPHNKTKALYYLKTYLDGLPTNGR